MSFYQRIFMSNDLKTRGSFKKTQLNGLSICEQHFLPEGFPALGNHRGRGGETSACTRSSASKATSLCYSPFLPDERDVQLISLQVFSGVPHNLIKSIFEQVISSDN